MNQTIFSSLTRHPVVVVGLVLAGLLLAAPAPSRATELDLLPPRIEMRPPVHTSREAITIRAKVTDQSDLRSVVIWVRQGRTAFRAEEMALGKDGLFMTRLLHRSGSKHVAYFVEAVDVRGNGPARAGDPAQPLEVEFFPQAFQPVQDHGPAFAGGLVLLIMATFYGVKLMNRQELFDMQKIYWFKRLTPLAHKRGHTVMRTIDRLLSHARRNKLFRGIEIARIDVLRWLNRLRQSRGVHVLKPADDRFKALARKRATGWRPRRSFLAGVALMPAMFHRRSPAVAASRTVEVDEPPMPLGMPPRAAALERVRYARRLEIQRRLAERRRAVAAQRRVLIRIERTPKTT
jgi:hypothetical protein